MRIRKIAISLLLLAAGSVRAADVVRTVAQDGSGDYRTVQEAFDAVPEHFTGGRWIIRVEPGRYYEKITLAEGKDRVTLVGRDARTTVLTYDDYSGKKRADGKDIGTSRCQSVAIDADDFIASNITFENTHLNIREQPGENKRSQGVALRVRGDRCALYDCRLVGNQDTFFGAGTGRIYLKNCYVEGNVDFIFGSSVMVFDRCTIHVNQHESYIVAPSTLPEMRFGIVFLDCRITAKAIGAPDRDGVPFRHFYLGRPWHGEPQAVYIRCEEPASVHPEGWTVMSAEQKLFAEYRCTGPGAAPERLARRIMSRELTRAEAKAYTVKRIFARTTFPAYGSDWKPAKDFSPGR